MKRKKKITVTRWAIVGRRNTLVCVAARKKDAITDYCGDMESWQHWKKQGRRAVKVQVSFEI